MKLTLENNRPALREQWQYETIHNNYDWSFAQWLADNKHTIDFERIKLDANGNPRYVCHFHSLLSRKELNSIDYDKQYNFAIKRANKLGGRKYHNKSYGGGIVFQSYNTDDLTKRILETHA